MTHCHNNTANTDAFLVICLNIVHWSQQNTNMKYGIPQHTTQCSKLNSMH